MATQSKKYIEVKPLAWLLTALYFSNYITRINFAAVIQEIVTDTGFEKSTLSVVLVCLSITYGVGQIVNGWLGDKVNPTNLIFFGLILATTINLIFPLFSFSIPMMSALWAVNGFAQAMMWPPMVKILVANTDDAQYSYAVVRICWGSSIATIVTYLCAPLIISIFGWKGVFIASATVGLTATLVWGALKSRVRLEEPARLPLEKEKSRSLSFPKAAIFPIVFAFLAIIFQGMLRDGVSAWMPTYLSEVFNIDNKRSILLTVSLAVFNTLAFSLFSAIYNKFFKNEIFCAASIFLASTLAAAFLYLFFEGGALIAILMMAIISGCMHGVNLMLITIIPKRFKKYGNISTISGLLNACTYVGSAIFTYGIALLSELIGWQKTVGIWAIIALLGALCCLVATLPWKKFMEK